MQDADLLPKLQIFITQIRTISHIDRNRTSRQQRNANKQLKKAACNNTLIKDWNVGWFFQKRLEWFFQMLEGMSNDDGWRFSWSLPAASSRKSFLLSLSFIPFSPSQPLLFPFFSFSTPSLPQLSVSSCLPRTLVAFCFFLQPSTCFLVLALSHKTLAISSAAFLFPTFYISRGTP